VPSEVEGYSATSASRMESVKKGFHERIESCISTRKDLGNFPDCMIVEDKNAEKGKVTQIQTKRFKLFPINCLSC